MDTVSRRIHANTICELHVSFSKMNGTKDAATQKEIKHTNHVTCVWEYF
jgi:hypothetical protein